MQSGTGSLGSQRGVKEVEHDFWIPRRLAVAVIGTAIPTGACWMGSRKSIVPAAGDQSTMFACGSLIAGLDLHVGAGGGHHRHRLRGLPLVGDGLETVTVQPANGASVVSV